jgi:hypothetical protein
VERKRRRVETAGIGVLFVLSAFDMDHLMVGVRAGAEAHHFPSACFYDILYFMVKSINDIPKKKRGRPATGKGEGVLVRLQPDQLKALDRWIATQDASLTRPEAIRAMMETVLHILSKDTGEKPAKAKGKG